MSHVGAHPQVHRHGDHRVLSTTRQTAQQRFTRLDIYRSIPPGEDPREGAAYGTRPTDAIGDSQQCCA